ncbi:hypothetical protein DM02DRAFT_643213 [Periconia macrospinosa]|uniref:Asteroid domain-containing protein n=1 Tax=Periconia macrospinosa TaxID=97972 RepID=A0A2V1DPC4_9PLEO|nr:hypothetical protein DM02DRAFT_643213 [Periconia macrospinosa]
MYIRSLIFRPRGCIEERISRQNQNNQRVKLLRSCYAASACPVPISLGSVSYSFLAPALRESLSNSKFSQATWVVPGEADEWCASCAYAAPRSVIFSSDSDMLLYEYHAETRIMFFNDIELMTEPEFKGYSPAHMTQNLGLTSLVPFAYYLMQDKHQLFNSLVERAKDVDVESKDYIDFSRRYGPGTSEPDILHENEVPVIFERLSKIPQNLDVRVSELVDQLQNNISSPAFYLPLLVEDPNSASAWNVGQDIRILAYSLLSCSIQAQPQTVREYLRKAQTITTQHLTLPNPPSILTTSITNLDTLLRTSLSIIRARQTPPELTFPLLSIFVILLPSLPSPPKISLLIRLLHADYEKTWDFVHLTARYHAILYSLRILKQSLSLALSLTPSTFPDQEQLSQLHELLVDMPSIEELFLVPGQAKVVSGNEERLRRLLPEMYRECGVEVPSEVDKKKAKKRGREAERKERRKREKEKEGGAKDGKAEWNVFDVLGGG